MLCFVVQLLSSHVLQHSFAAKVSAARAHAERTKLMDVLASRLCMYITSAATRIVDQWRPTGLCRGAKSATEPSGHAHLMLSSLGS